MTLLVNDLWPSILTAFFVSAAVSRLLAYIYVKKGWCAPSRTGGAMPLTGGIGIVCSLLLMQLLWFISVFWRDLGNRPDAAKFFLLGVFFNNFFPFFLAYLYFAFGLLDDIYHFRPKPKLLGFAIVLAIYAAFQTIHVNTCSHIYTFDYVRILIIMAGTFFFANSYNFLDNANGHCACSLLGLFLALLLLEPEGLSVRSDPVWLSTVVYFGCSILSGALLGFLFWNFRKKAKLYLGDAGSLFLGASAFLLAMRSYYVYKFTNVNFPYQASAQEFLLCVNFFLILFAYPIYDTCAVMLLRVLRGQNPTIGGQDHYSHRLMRGGFPLWLVNLIAFTAAGILPVVFIKLPEGAIYFGPLAIWVFLLLLDVLAAVLRKRAVDEPTLS